MKIMMLPASIFFQMPVQCIFLFEVEKAGFNSRKSSPQTVGVVISLAVQYPYREIMRLSAHTLKIMMLPAAILFQMPVQHISLYEAEKAGFNNKKLLPQTVGLVISLVVQYPFRGIV